MKKAIFSLSLCMFIIPAIAEQTKPNVQLIQGDRKVDVMIGGKLFTSYVYGNKLTKPVLVPVCTPSGVEVNRRHPLTEIEGASTDHPASINYPTWWHVRDYGLFSANPLGQGDFQKQRPRQYRENKVIPLRLTLEPGETAHFRFLVIIYDGMRTKEQIEERFRDFIKN